MSLFTKLFGGSRNKSKSTQESYNQAYPFLQDQLGGAVGNVGGASNSLAAMLGIGGDTGAQKAAFDTFKNSIGYDFMLDSGISAIKGGNASRGLFNSGATGQALMQYGQNLANTTYGSYMDRLLGLGQLGNQSAGVIADAGRRSEMESVSSGKTDTGGLGKALGFILSERSEKTNITKLGEFEDGLGMYAYEYKKEPGVTYIGVMADEVEDIRPWALGPTTEEGHRTVDYSKLEEGTE